MTENVSHSDGPPPLLEALRALAEEVRDAFCQLLQDEVDILAAQLIELETLRGEVAEPALQARFSAIGASLDALRAEKARLALQLRCVSVPGDPP